MGAGFLDLFARVGGWVGRGDRVRAQGERRTRAAAEPGAEAAKVEYFCPMHPQIVRSEPGSCPLCGMPLSRREKGEAGALPEGVLARVQLSPLRVAQGGVRTAEVAAKPLVREVRTAGFVEVDERREKRIAARVAGRIDAL